MAWTIEDTLSALRIIAGLGWAIAGGLIVGHLMIHVRPDGVRANADVWRSSELGVVERALYFIAVFSAHYEVIAAWLVLKAAARWQKWADEAGIFNSWAVGTGLSMAFGVAGGLLPDALKQQDLVKLAAIFLGPLALSGLIFVMRLGFARSVLDPEVHQLLERRRDSEESS